MNYFVSLHSNITIMSSFNLKDNNRWREFLIYAALVVTTVAITVWAMPHDSSSIYHIEQGRPWKYGELTAPFDFAVSTSATVR